MPPFEEHTVTYGPEPRQKKIFYLAAGPPSGPLLIFLHGWPGIAQTWHHQLSAFAALGFRALAPDMPGYGRSTARTLPADYAQERVVEGMLAVLADAGREQAVWVGHDWGCATAWTLASTAPEACRAVVGLAVPYRSLELGLEELLRWVDRGMYPEDEYPWGQWGYQAFYEREFERAARWMERDVAGFLGVLMRRGKPGDVGRPAVTSSVVKDGGWFGGVEKPPSLGGALDAAKSSIDPETFEELVAAMEETGFVPGEAWYMNHKANRQYNLENSKKDGRLEMPVLFVHARYDAICATLITRSAEPMRKLCANLTETTIDAGHWVLSEKPMETNSALARWLAEEVKDWWPGYWMPGFVKSRV